MENDIVEETKLLIRKAHMIGYQKGYKDGFESCRNEIKGDKSMYQEILDKALLPRHRVAGLYLEDEEDFLYIKRDGATLATFPSISATYEVIHNACDRILNREGFRYG